MTVTGELAPDPLGLRPTTLLAGVDTSVIALWLGHAGVRSTDAYVHAGITIKGEGTCAHHADLCSARPLPPSDKVLTFLESL
ncbi:MAG: hypothetical protein ACSLFD_08700 [Solirubrobacterales bacterium]